MSINKIDNRVIAAVAFIAVLALIAKPIWDGREQWQFGPGQDDGVYMVTAKALASGEGYRQDNLPGRPAATKYPPLYPLYLSLAWRIRPDFPRTLVTASMLQDGLLPVYLAVLFLVLRQLGLSWRRTFLVAALTFVSFSFVFLSVTLYSELLFGCFLLAAIWTIERAALLDSGRWALAGGLLTGLAYLTRNAALPLLAAAPVFFFLRKRLRLSVYFFAVAIPMALVWHVWAAVQAPVSARSPYFDEYLRVIRTTGLLTNILNQVSTLSASIAESLFPGIVEFLHGIPLYHLVLAAAIAGNVRMGLRRQWPLLLIFTGMYLAIIILWREGGGRLMLPVWPVLMAGIAEEASHFASLCAHSIARPGFKEAPRWALIALALGIVLRSDAFTWRRTAAVYVSEREQRGRDRLAYAWLAGHAGKDSIVLAWKDSLCYLYTGIPSSHSLFVAAIPQSEVITGLRTSFSLPPGEFNSALVLLLASDLGTDFKGGGLDSFRATAAAVAGSRLEYSAPGVFVYRFPINLSAP